MNIKEKVYAALNGSSVLTAILAKDKRGQCIYHGLSPDAGSYPILVYSVISDVPAVVADATEMERRVTFRIHIITTDGAYEPIYREVVRIMLGLGFMRLSTQEIAEQSKNLTEFIKIVDFRIGIGVNE
mgnify:FL=1